MSIAGFSARNHPQQTEKRGAIDEVDDRGTDPVFVAGLEERFGAPFTLDVAAAAHNAKAPRYFTRAEDGLAQSWAGSRVWCNPPYSDLYSWVSKAWKELKETRGIVMLLPANRCEQKWWQELVEPHRDRPGSALKVEFLPGRMRFDRPDATIGPKGDRPPFGCVLLIWSDPREFVLTIGLDVTIYRRSETRFEVECSRHGLVARAPSRAKARVAGQSHLNVDCQVTP